MAPDDGPGEGPRTAPPAAQLFADRIPLGETATAQPATVVGATSRAAPAEPASGRATRPPVVARERFESELLESGLIDLQELREFYRGLPADRQPADGEQVARELVRAGRLTRFQAASIYQGKAKGLSIGPYLVLDKLGSGGMGMVLKAIHRARRNIVALKVLPAKFASKASALSRFQREARAMARINHPNIVSILDLDEDRGVPFLVMDYADGRDFSRIVAEEGTQSVALAAHCLAQAALGLQAAHDRGIVHRDVKPANLLLDRDGMVKVLDLGLARIVAGENPSDLEGLTKSGTFLGTLDYLSPEQASDAKRVDARADIYALGCTLHYILTGKPPYPAGTMLTQLVAHREAPIPSLRDARPDVPPALDRLFRRMLAKDPNDRPRSMHEVLAEVEAVRGSDQGEAAPRSHRDRLLGAKPHESPLALSDLMIDLGPGNPGPESASVVAARRRRRWVRGLLIGVAAVEVVATVLFGSIAAFGFRPDSGPLAPPRVVRKPAPPVPEDEPPAAARPAVKAAPEMGEIRKFEGHALPNVEAVAASPDGRQALSGGEDGTLRLWDWETGEQLALLDAHAGPVHGVAFSPNGQEALSCGQDGLLIHWDLEKREPIRRLKGHVGTIRAVAFASDGSRALSGGDDKTVRLWDLNAGRELACFQGHVATVFCVAFSPDDRRALSGGGVAMRLWDLETRKQIGLFEQNQGKIASVAFSFDGRHALSGSADGNVRLWDMKLGRMVKQLEGHRAPVRAVAFSPDGLRALSGGDGDALVLWDLGTGLAQHRFPLNHYKVASLAFTPDGLHALTACDDRFVRLWKLPPIPGRHGVR